MNRLLVVTNASAGSSDRDNVAAALEVLRGAADVRVAECADPSELARALADRDGRTVVVAGGDGTLHLAVSTLHARRELSPDDPLGLLPLGTGNDFARTMGLPLDPADAARVILSGRARVIDLVVDDAGGVVVNAVHLGIGATAAEQASALKDRLGRTAYVVGSVVAGVRGRGWSLRVEADGQVLHDGEALLVGIANGRTIGGGTVLAPDAQPDNGLVDVVVATSAGPVARLGFGVAMRSGEHVEREDVLTVKARTVAVSGEPYPLNADGELEGPVTSRTWSVEPSAWALSAPTTR